MHTETAYIFDADVLNAKKEQKQNSSSNISLGFLWTMRSARDQSEHKPMIKRKKINRAQERKVSEECTYIRDVYLYVCIDELK